MSEFHDVRTTGTEGGVDASEGRAIGLDLEALLDAGMPPLRVAVQIVAAVAEILAIAEEDGVVHGDLDLCHVFVDDTGAVSVEGFGLKTTIAPEGTPVGPATDRFGLGALGYALFSPQDLPELPEGEEPHENAVIDAVLNVNLDGLPEDLIGDVQWYLVRLLTFQPHDRPPALEVWRAFGTMTDLIDGPDFVTWCDEALDGGGERRDREQASRPMARPLKGELDETSVTGGPLPKGAVNFEDGAADKGRSTAFWTRQGMKTALARAMSSDYIEQDANSDWMPGTPIPPMDRNTSPGGARWSGPAPVPKRAPGEGRSRAEKRSPPPSPLPAPPRGGPKATPKAATPKAAPPVPAPAPASKRNPSPPTPTPAPPRAAPEPIATPGWAPSFDTNPRDDDKTELGAMQVPTNKPMTPKPTPMRSVEPIARDAPTQRAPIAEGPTEALVQPPEPVSDRSSRGGASRPRRGASAPTPEPLPDPDTSPQFQHRPKAPNSPVETWSPGAAVAPVAPDVDTARPPEAEAPAALSVEPPPSSARLQGPIPDVDLSRQPDPFAEVQEPGPNLALLGAIGAFVMVAVIFCVGVGGIGGAAAILAPVGSSSASKAPAERQLAKAQPRAPREARPSPAPLARPEPTSGSRATVPDPTPTGVTESPKSLLPGVQPQTGALPAPTGPAGSPRPQPSPEPRAAVPARPQPAPFNSPTPSPSSGGSIRPRPTPVPDVAPSPRPDPLASFAQPEPVGFPPPSPVSSVRPGGPSTRTGTLPTYPLPEQAGDSILPFLVPEPAPKPDGSGPNAMQMQMRQHLSAATAARDAVVRGDADGARTSAQALEFINPVDGLPPSWLPYVVDLRMEAWLMGNSPDLAAAGFKVAQIGQSCATCHEGVRAGPTVTPAAVPSKVFAEADVMKRHAWATDWMWVGLLANDQAAWTKGATVLVESPFPSVIFEDFPDQRFMDLEDKLHELAREGQTATAPDKRALVYGKMLATCARCHDVYREKKP